jgi:hypothetical protein
MVLLGDESQVDACFGMFEDSANLDARQLHGLRRTYHRLRKSFCTHPMDLLSDISHLESHLYPFRDSGSVDRCTIFAKRTMGTEIIFGRARWYS